MRHSPPEVADMFESVQGQGLQTGSRRGDRRKAHHDLLAVTGGDSSAESVRSFPGHRKLTDSYTSMKSRFRDSAADLKRLHTLTAPKSAAAAERHRSATRTPSTHSTEAADGSLKQRFQCPEDIDLHKLSQLGTGWCSCIPPSAEQKATGLGSTLQESEWDSIRHALAKAEMCEKLEQRRIGRLIKAVEQLKLQRRARNAVPNQCHNCGFMFTGLAWLMAIGYTTCAGCRKCICQNSTCLVAIKSRSGNTRWVCRLCSKLLEVWTKSGVWFYKTLPSYDAVDDETIGRLTPLLLEMNPQRRNAPSKLEPKQPLQQSMSLPRIGNLDGLSPRASHSSRNRPVRRQRINQLYESPPDTASIVQSHPRPSNTGNLQEESDSSPHDDRHPLGVRRTVSALDQLGLRAGGRRGARLPTLMDARPRSVSPLPPRAMAMASPPAATVSPPPSAAAAAVEAVATVAAFVAEGGVVLPSVTSPSALSRGHPEMRSFRSKSHSVSGTNLLHEHAQLDNPDVRNGDDRRSLPLVKESKSKHSRAKSLPGSATRALIVQARKSNPAVPSAESDGVDLAAVVLDACLPPAQQQQQQQQQSHRRHLGSVDIDEEMEMRDVVSDNGLHRRQTGKFSLSPKKLGDGRTEAYLGSIEFTVLYKNHEQQLVITILGCKDLIAMDFHGASDPFVRLKLLPYHRKSSRSSNYETSTKKRTLNPEYNESFTYHGIESSEVQYLILRLVVYDHDTLTANDFLGEVIFRMKNIQPNMLLNCNRLLEISPQLRRESVDFSSMHIRSTGLGKLLVSICYQPEEGKLCVGVVRAAGLPAVDIFSKSCDPYVKCYLLPDPSKSSKRRTMILKRTSNPEFNEKFSYDVDTRTLMSSTLEISVWDYNYTQRNRLIGCVQLSATCGPEVSQWLDAMCTPNEQFTVWHKLKPRRRVSPKIKVTEL